MREELIPEAKEIINEMLKTPLQKQRKEISDGTIIMLTPGRPNYLSVRLDFVNGFKTNFGGSIEGIKK